MNTFTYNGTALSGFGGKISKKSIYVSPEIDQTFNSIPGKSGDVIIDNGKYKNVDVSYTCQFLNISDNIKGLKLWLCKSGYYVLSDTYDTDYFRYAAYASKLKLDEMIKNVGSAEIVFNCKPYRYSNVGQTKITLTSSGTVVNPEAFPSEPYIKITGSGNVTLSIGSKAYYITGISSYIELDSEMMAAYKASVLQNSKIGFIEFPLLYPGNNAISWTGTVTKVEIIPRWRTL